MNYQNQPVGQILDLWIALNTQVVNIVANLPEESTPAISAKDRWSR
ncbi:hypothetical protein [Paenibacillus terrigena]|nr:hypothetical protein [Paenibacillus terrigena]